jgi:hypothetical protein
LAKKKDENYVAVGGILLPATPELKEVEKQNKGFLDMASEDPLKLDLALRIAAGEVPPDADLVTKTEKLLETLPTPDPDEVQPTIGREEIVFLDEMFTTVPDVTKKVSTVRVTKDATVYGEKVKSTGGSTSYYEIPDGATELNDLIEAMGMCFALGNIFKACYRLGEKADTDLLYDINKIIFFAERLKKYVEENGRLP